MQPLICPNCGGHINRATFQCEYCGTRFKEEGSNILHVETFQSPCDIYSAKITIPSEFVASDPEAATQIATDKLSRSLTDAFKSHMRLEIEHDPMNNYEHISARVRVLREDFMF